MSWGTLRGQERAAKSLQGFLDSKRIPQAVLFTGPDGVGKMLAARQWAQALLCQSPDQYLGCRNCSSCLSVDKGIHSSLRIVNADYQASLRQEDAAKQKTLKVETIRHLRKDMEMRPMAGGWQIAIIEKADTLESQGANALLKILEEPLDQSLWILTTAIPTRLPKTVASRCFRVPFGSLKASLVEEILIALGIDPDKAKRASSLCEGSVSSALELSENLDELLNAAKNLLSPFEASQLLPRELYASRLQVEQALNVFSMKIWNEHRDKTSGFENCEKSMRHLFDLRKALSANADPKSVLILAGLAAQSSIQDTSR